MLKLVKFLADGVAVATFREKINVYIMAKRLLLLLLLLLAFSRLQAQHIAGKVIDRETRQPIVRATFVCHTAVAFTTADGHFSLSGVRLADTVSVTYWL